MCVYFMSLTGGFIRSVSSFVFNKKHKVQESLNAFLLDVQFLYCTKVILLREWKQHLTNNTSQCFLIRKQERKQ